MTDDTLSPSVWETLHAALAKFSKPFPAEALALADAHREEIAPHLVAELESLASDPSRMADDSDYMLLDYAAHLLAWWRDPRGLAPLLSLARIPDRDLHDEVFGDYLNNALGRCLASMARSHLQPLMELAEDTQADPYARGAALEAMKACVIEGDAPRDRVLAYVRDLAPRAVAESRADNDDPAFLNFVVDLAADLGDSDMLPAIQGWFDEGVLDPFLVDMEDIEHAATQPLAQHLQELRERGKGYIRDPETEMAWWHCFQEDPPRDATPDARAWAAPSRESARIVSPPPPAQPQVRESPKVGRNDPCPCGSGKKYKKCHGAA
jgi:hypothetical protein